MPELAYFPKVALEKNVPWPVLCRNQPFRQTAVKRDNKILAAEHAKEIIQNEPDFLIDKYLSGEPYQEEEFKSKMTDEWHGLDFQFR